MPTLAQLRSGKLLVRQKPGPIEFARAHQVHFPNEHNVYLHSTPAQSLFSQSRRDFSQAAYAWKSRRSWRHGYCEPAQMDTRRGKGGDAIRPG